MPAALRAILSGHGTWCAAASSSTARATWPKRWACSPSCRRIAVLPIGYADGLHRALSNQIEVLTPYGRAKQVGRICMDMCMIDVTDLPQVKSGDEVEIFGEHILCADDAALCDTIPYELMCAVSKRVPRVYRLNGVSVDKNLQPL